MKLLSMVTKLGHLTKLYDKLNENILLNNGRGLGITGKVLKIEKKSVAIEVINIKKELRNVRSIALCMVKEALNYQSGKQRN